MINNDNIREKYIEKEQQYLTEFAAKSDSKILTARQIQGDTYDFRLDFQRDRDRIIHSRSFRRLMHKTQVFNANIGDHYRNRLTHTLEVSQIARSLSKLLGLNEDLTEAIALGHDVGHTPFGHIGERTLHMIISGKMHEYDEEFNTESYGGFKHNYQSLQILDNIEKRSTKYNGLNLCFAVREGIFKHTSNQIRVPKNDFSRNITEYVKDDVYYSSLNLENMRVNQCSITLEGQVVAIADEIAQCTHDLEDGIRAKIITFDGLIQSELIKLLIKEKKIELSASMETVDFRNILIRQMVGYLIENVYDNSIKLMNDLKVKNEIPSFKNYDDVYTKQYIDFSGEIKNLQSELSKLITRIVISSQEVTQADNKSEYIIKKLFKAYYLHPQQLPDYILKRYFSKIGQPFDRLKIDPQVINLRKNADFIRLICDHISGMTDQYAAREYKKLYSPEYF